MGLNNGLRVAGGVAKRSAKKLSGGQSHATGALQTLAC